jgi:hypothetical protein
MADSSVPELLATSKSVLDTAGRTMAIARALAEGYRSGLRPPEDVLDAYLARLDRDEAQLKTLRERLAALQIRLQTAGLVS